MTAPISEPRPSELPIAEERWQVSPEALARVSAVTDSITLRGSVRVLTARDLLVALALYGVPVAVVVSAAVFDTKVPEVARFPLVAAVVVFMSSAAFIQFWRNWTVPVYPIIQANYTGLTMTTPKETRTIPWESICVWCIELPPTRNAYGYAGWRYPGYTYSYEVFASDGFFSKGDRLYWEEPESAKLLGTNISDDRRRAFRERADSLRAMIALRTGLPLREWGPDVFGEEDDADHSLPS